METCVVCRWNFGAMRKIPFRSKYNNTPPRPFGVCSYCRIHVRGGCCATRTARPAVLCSSHPPSIH